MTIQARKTILCQICTMPLEYCEFSGTQEKCKSWLKEKDYNLFIKYYESNTEGNDEKSIVKDKSAKLEAKIKQETKKKMASRVIIKRIERTKRKSVTTVSGLDIFDVDLKKAAKLFANKFACGSSVARNNQGLEEIIVQGDFSEEIYKSILCNWTIVPEENIDRIEEKKKKKIQD